MQTRSSSKRENSTIQTRTASESAMKTPTKRPTTRSRSKATETNPSAENAETDAEEALLMLSTPTPRKTRKAAASSSAKPTARVTRSSSKASSTVKSSEDESQMQSSDESFVSASEAPENAATKQQTESMVDALETQMEVISDLSDVEDPHFAKIMTQAAESATISAVSDKSESIADDTEADENELPKGKHTVFGSDMEASEDEDQDDGGLDKTSLAKSAGDNVDSNDDDDDNDNDDAPEMIDTKASASKTEMTAEDDVPAEDEAKEKEKRAKNKKSRRSRGHKSGKHKKQEQEQGQQAAGSEVPEEGKISKRSAGNLPAVVRGSVEKAIQSVAKLSIRPETAMPEEIPEELRIDLAAVAESKKRKLEQSEPAAVSSSGKLDMSILEQFASESATKHSAKKEAAGSDKAALSDKKKKRRNNRKLKKDESSRVVSGIRVVANKQESSMSLLSSLAQSVPKRVRYFSKEKAGGARVERTNPLIDIARQRRQAAIHFLK
ncbi:hypothetical protein J3B02_004070 [Coemansia erecta]|nr:hypothetical protein J3B02_004070 [Coemansia erecta]